MAIEGRWKAVAVDLDGTLIRGTTVCLHLGDWIGHRSVIEDLERRFASGEITNAQVAEGDAPYYAGLSLGEISAALSSVPLLDDIYEGVQLLNRAGIITLLCTVTWSFAATLIGDRFGFQAVSGCVMGANQSGRLSGRVEEHFEPEDKVEFIRAACAPAGITTDQVVAIGDGRSDLPMFAAAGFSVAVNGTAEAVAAASESVQSNSFMDALRAVPGLVPSGGRNPRL